MLKSSFDRPLRLEPLEDRLLLAITVDTLVDEADSSIVDGDISLRDAIAVATAGETIDFSVNGTINLTLGELTINKNLTVNGPGNGLLTVDAGGSSRVLLITSGTVDISGLTFSSGNADQGGGIKNESGTTTTLTDMLIQGNTATSNNYSAGGGIWNEGDLTITRSTISNNMTTVGSGSGAGAWNGGTLAITRSTITGNLSIRDGGGLYSNAFVGGVTIADSTISGNSAGDDAGGIFIYLGTNSITGSTISGNTAAGDDGGGIWSFGNLDITNSTISGNSAADRGGGWFSLQDAPTTILHSTVTGNSAASGGGIYLQGAVLTLGHTLVANNTAAIGPDVRGTFRGDWSLIENTTDTTIIGANNITGMDPMLDVLSDNGGHTLTHALLPGSQAIDMGDPAFTSPPDFDQRGFAFDRVIGGRIDMGAVESGAVSADFNLDGVVSGFDFLLWQIGFGATGTAVHGDGDANIDTDVNNADLDVWELQYGAAAPIAAAVSAPISTESFSSTSVRQSLLTIAELADLALAVVQRELSDNNSDLQTAAVDAPPLEFFAQPDRPSGSARLYAALLDKPAVAPGSTTNSPRDDAEQSSEESSAWEDVVDELFASAFK